MGIYRYLPIEHHLLVLLREKDLSNKIVAATFHQSFKEEAPVTFIWTTIPNAWSGTIVLRHIRLSRWMTDTCARISTFTSLAIGAGTCAIAAYHQELMDMLLEVDGDNEFTVDLAVVEKI